jgi:predicted lipid-binding transport protein (Tim44 family)
MKRDTLRTIAGIIIIGLIILVTFLYGNAQRESKERVAANTKASTTQQPKAATKSTPASKAAKPEAQPKPAVVATPTVVADTGGSNSAMPDTGASEDALVPLTLLGTALYLLRRSRRALVAAVRSR